MTSTLSALAELIRGGLSPRAALGVLAGAGGEPGAWAKRMVATSRSVGLGPALAQSGAVSRAEVARAGGTDALARGGTLGWLMGRRGLASERARACVRTMILPALWSVSTVSAGTTLLSIGGASTLSYWALMPLVLLGLAIYTARRYGWPDRLCALLPLHRWTRAHFEAEYASRLASTLRDGAELDVALAAAARCAGPLGKALGPAPPIAPTVSDPLALALATGQSLDDLPERLDAFAAARQAQVTRLLVWITRLAAWSIVLWVGFRVLGALVQMPIGGLEGVDLGGGRAGELDELMRELGM